MHLTLRTCHLCSKLSLVFSRLRGVFSKIGRRCRRINEASSDEKLRVDVVNQACPECICEKHTTSRFSPGLILNEERLTRFIFSPVHVRKSGDIKPSAFSHVFQQGCSIQRESIVTEGELVSFVTDYLTKNPSHMWHGVLIGDCGLLRQCLLESSGKRALCVYDTAEKHNPAHGEIHKSQ